MKEAEIEAEGGVASLTIREQCLESAVFPVPSLDEHEHGEWRRVGGESERASERERERAREREREARARGECNLFYRDVGEGSTRFD